MKLYNTLILMSSLFIAFRAKSQDVKEVVLPTITNMNDVMPGLSSSSQSYFFKTAPGISNMPSATYVNYGIVAAYDINSFHQIAFGNADDNMYLRMYAAGYGPWRKIWHSGNFDPTGYLKIGTNPSIKENNNSFIEAGSYNGYSYLQSHGSQPLHLNPLGNHVLIPTANLAIGTITPSVFKLLIDNGGTRNGIRITSDGDGSAYSDFNFAVKNPENTNGAPTVWNISHRKDGFFTASPGMSSLEFYAELKGGGYFAPLCFKLNGDVVLVSPNNTTASGNVSIGTTDSKGYKLAVNGAIRTKKVVVTQSDWPDYVFDSSYQLPSLDSVSTFIQVNKHLPDMPSAAIVEKDGHDLGEVQKLLLKKVEELTLYVIQQQKEIENLKAKVAQQEEKK